jgi:hypothetical protein
MDSTFGQNIARLITPVATGCAAVGQAVSQPVSGGRILYGQPGLAGGVVAALEAPGAPVPSVPG